MINLPTHLTIDHLFEKERRIKTSVKKHTQTSSIQPDQINQTEEMLKMLVSDSEQFYDQQFVRIFCLIKINALLADECNINTKFIEEFIKVYNGKLTIPVRISKYDDQFFSQVILESQLFKHIQIQNLHNVLGGQCLLATSLALIIKQTQKFLKKAEITFALSFLALSGRYQAFIPHVHKQKNHQGQIKFAETIFEYIKIDDTVKYARIQIEGRKVQDPYSMRCSPQVYGVVYECLNFVSDNFDVILNKFHFRNIVIDGKEYPNLDLSADNQVLKGDFLVCSLNEIGAMAFLRSERILNIYLGKNQVHKQNPKQVYELKSKLEKTIHLCADNKIIATPSNIDTMNIDNYEKDVFFTGFKVYQNFTKMLANLYKIMLLEIETALLGLNNIYNIGGGQIFMNLTLRKQFVNIQRHFTTKNGKQSLFFIANEWQVQKEQVQSDKLQV